MKPLQIYIPEELLKSLKQRALDEGTTMSDIVRRKLDIATLTEAYVKTAVFEAPELDPERDHALKARLLKEQAVKAFNGKELKQCKNGHYIPDGRFKCLEKGCKYA